MGITPYFLTRLGLDPNADERAVRRAYAREVKLIDQESDAEGFQRLRQAYEAALAWAKRQTGSPRETPSILPLGTLPDTAEAPFLAEDCDTRSRATEEDGPDPEVMAEIVYSKFLTTLRDPPFYLDLTTSTAIQKELVCCLEDARMLRIAARESFERRIANLLVDEFCPKQKALFMAAARQFDWRTDRRRLAQFGPAGAALNRAIDEGVLDNWGPEGRPVRKQAPRQPPPPAKRTGSYWTLAIGMMLVMAIARSAYQSSGQSSVPPAPRPAKSGRAFDPAAPAFPSTSQPMNLPGTTGTGRGPIQSITASPAAKHADPSAATAAQISRPLINPTLMASIQAIKPLQGETGQKLVAKANPITKSTAFDSAHQPEDASASAAQPKTWHDLYKSGFYARESHNYERAIADLTESIRLNPSYDQAFIARGNAWADQKEYDRALADYDEAIRLSPNQALPYYNRGWVWSKKGNFAFAITDLDEAIRRNPVYFEAYTMRGNARRKTGDYDGAIADYDAAIRLNPKDTIAYGNRGFAWQGKKDFDKAIADYSEIIRQNPFNAEAVFARAGAYQSKGDRARALTDYREAARLNPSYARYVPKEEQNPSATEIPNNP